MQLLKRKVHDSQEAVVEKVYFKHNYQKFVSQYYPSKPDERTLWAISLQDEKHTYLGKVINGKLVTPPFEELRIGNKWSTIKGADRLYKWIEFGEKAAKIGWEV